MGFLEWWNRGGKKDAAVWTPVRTAIPNGLPQPDPSFAGQPMTLSNYAFIGGSLSWAMSAWFVEMFPNVKEGASIAVKFKDRVFAGRMAKMPGCWGAVEHLQCPFPADFADLVAGPYGRSLDCALNAAGALVMTYTPAMIHASSQQLGESAGELAFAPLQTAPRSDDLIANAVEVRLLSDPFAVDSSALAKMHTCAHGQRKSISADPGESFLCRTYEVCSDCGVALSRSGACARDACGCSLHSASFEASRVELTW